MPQLGVYLAFQSLDDIYFYCHLALEAFSKIET